MCFFPERIILTFHNCLFKGTLDGADNCPLTANADQANNDGDAMGDLCDDDDDNDGN